ncbi:MAG: helix-turn-helix transcriptional regulator [Pseudomonadota bacterium]
MNELLSIPQIVRQFNQRREQLGISQSRLAELSGISLPTVQRFFSDNSSNISMETVYKMAKILGLNLIAEEVMDTQRIIENRAREKAQKLAAMVQGTSSLEGQGLAKKSYKMIEQNLFHALVSGSKRKLWDS